MPTYRFTGYFEEEVLRKRPFLWKEWCIRARQRPLRVERQENNRYRFWVQVPELEGRYLRVITLDDQVTILNAFPDRGFRASGNLVGIDIDNASSKVRLDRLVLSKLNAAIETA